jgi:hypothetical protein
MTPACKVATPARPAAAQVRQIAGCSVSDRESPWATLLTGTQRARQVWDHELVVRQMGNETYRQQQWADRRAPHIASVNDLIDELTASPGRGEVPYVAPVYADVDARALLSREILARRPGANMAAADSGPRLISPE